MKLTGDRCRCSVCGELFNSTAAFGKHRTGSFEKNERRCLNAKAMLKKGMAKNGAQFWVTKLREIAPQTFP